MRIGFIGLGIMGSRMAAHLQAHGHDLVVHNRTRSKADALVAGGATWADTPAAVAAQNPDVLITMLAHPDAVRATALGEGGFLAALPAGTLWVDCSTVNPAFAREMAAAAEAHDLRKLDAPVAGSKHQADAAELIFMVGGAAADVQTAQPLFEIMGSRFVHVGDQGMGIALKLVANTLLATSMAAFAEAMAFGQSMGLGEETLLNVFVGGPVVAPFMAGKKPKITSGDYDPEFPLQWMHKDLHMATLTAYESGAPVPLAALAREMFQMAVQAGHGEQDFSAIYAYMNEDT